MPGMQLRAGLLWLFSAVANCARQVDDCMKVLSGAAPASSAKEREEKILASCKLNRPRIGILEHDAAKDCSQLVGLWKTAVHYQPGVSAQGFCNTLKDFAPPGRPLTPPGSPAKGASKATSQKHSESVEDDSATPFSELVAEAAQSAAQPGADVQNDTVVVSTADQVKIETPPPKTGKPAELDELLFVDSCVQYATTVEGRIRTHQGLGDRVLQSCEDHLSSEKSFCHGYVSLIRRHAKHPELVRFCGSGYQLMQAAGTLPTSTDGIWGPAQVDEDRDEEGTQTDELAGLPDGVPPDPLTALTTPEESVGGVTDHTFVTDDALLGESSQVGASPDPTADAEAAMVDAAGSTLAGATDITDPTDASANAMGIADPTDPLASPPTDDGFSSLASSDGPTPESLTAFESTISAQDPVSDGVAGMDEAAQADSAAAISTDSGVESTALLDASSSSATSSPDPQSVLDEAASVLDDGSPKKKPLATLASFYSKAPLTKVHRQTYLVKSSQTQSVRIMKHALANKLKAKPSSREGPHTKHRVSKSDQVAKSVPHRSSFAVVGDHEEHSVVQRVKETRLKQTAVATSKTEQQRTASAKPLAKHTKTAKEAELIAKAEHKHAPKRVDGHSTEKSLAGTGQKHVVHVEPNAISEHHHGSDIKPAPKVEHKQTSKVVPDLKTEVQKKDTHSELAGKQNHEHPHLVKAPAAEHHKHVSNHEHVAKVQLEAKPVPKHHNSKTDHVHTGMIASHVVGATDAHHPHSSRSADSNKVSTDHLAVKRQMRQKEGKKAAHAVQHPSFIADSDLGKSFKQVLADHAKRRAELEAKSSAMAAAEKLSARQKHKVAHKVAMVSSKPGETAFKKGHHASASLVESAHAALASTSTKPISRPVAPGFSLSQSHGVEKISTADLFGDDSDLFGEDPISKPSFEKPSSVHETDHPKPPAQHASLMSMKANKIVQKAHQASPDASVKSVQKTHQKELYGDDLFEDDSLPKPNHQTLPTAIETNTPKAAAPQASLISAKNTKIVPKAHQENLFGDDIFEDDLTSKPKSKKLVGVPKTNHAKPEARGSLISAKAPKIAQNAHHPSRHVARARAVQDPSSSSAVNSFFEEFVSNWRGEAPHHDAKSSVQRITAAKDPKHVKRAARLSLVQAQAPRSWRVHHLPMTAADEFFEGFVSRYGQQIDTGVSDSGVSRGQRGMSLIGSESSISHVKSRPSKNKKAIDTFLDGFKDRFMPEDRDLNGKEPPRPALISAEAQGKSLISTGSSGDIFADDGDDEAEQFVPPYRPGGSTAAWQAFTRAAFVSKPVDN